MKKDALLTGILSGIIGPIIGFFLYYLMVFRHRSVMSLLYHAKESHFLSALLSLSLIANLALFFIFIKLNADTSARGVLLVTIIYAIVGFAIKFFM